MSITLLGSKTSWLMGFPFSDDPDGRLGDVHDGEGPVGADLHADAAGGALVGDDPVGVPHEGVLLAEADAHVAAHAELLVDHHDAQLVALEGLRRADHHAVAALVAEDGLAAAVLVGLDLEGRLGRVVHLEDLDGALHLTLMVAVAPCVALLEIDHQLFHGSKASGLGPVDYTSIWDGQATPDVRLVRARTPGNGRGSHFGVEALPADEVGSCGL